MDNARKQLIEWDVVCTGDLGMGRDVHLPCQIHKNKKRAAKLTAFRNVCKNPSCEVLFGGNGYPLFNAPERCEAPY